MTTKAEKTNRSQQYVCIDENVGRLVYCYYNEVLGNQEARGFEEHLLLCFKCQETVFTLDSILEAIGANREEWLGPKEWSKKKSSIKAKGET